MNIENSVTFMLAWNKSSSFYEALNAVLSIDYTNILMEVIMGITGTL